MFASLADPGYDPIQVAPFFLADLSYVTIGIEQGVMGTYSAGHGTTFQSVQWRHQGVDIEMSAFGVDASELLALAARAATRTDGRWTERDWTAAEEAVGEAAEPVTVQQALQFGDEGGGTLTARRFGSALSWWVEGSTGFGIGRYGEQAQPVVLQVATNNVPAIDPAGVSYVVALALGDASIDGATLRLRTGALVTAAEGDGAESGTSVHSIGDDPGDAAAGAPSDFGYTLAGAVALPWTDGGFVAELVAADGVTILATATPADL